ncbi:DUF4232 domain-containing protein [Streptomyces sp. CRN 30]|uniref:DUF4232 domain-containing protein n=1 Tax=Streptomyces sp. CRN 30 TaxID=3075613 RepID=UPI002A83EBE7|nr:DUF4232 domain-containing protein [Streptomyces sp. CRN 30]
MRTTTRPPVLAAASVVAALTLLTSCSDEGGTTDGRGDDSACRIGESGTEVTASPAPAAGDTGTVTVTLTNRGSECVLDGFPAVTLTADATSGKLDPDDGASAQRLTLAEGGAASFTLTYVRGEDDGDGLDVRAARFALPGGSATHEIPWSYGAVATESEAPEATVSAFQQVGD